MLSSVWRVTRRHLVGSIMHCCVCGGLCVQKMRSCIRIHRQAERLGLAQVGGRRDVDERFLGRLPLHQNPPRGAQMTVVGELVTLENGSEPE